MLEFLNDNIGLFTLVLGIIVIVLLVKLAVQSNSLTKNLVTKKFSFENLYETDKDTGEKEFVLVLANKTLNDTSITDVGFMLDSQTFSYNEEFRAQNDFVSGDKAVVTQRSSLKLIIRLVDLEKTLFKHKRCAKIKKLRAYVVDSSGYMISAPVKRIQRIVREDYKSMLNAQRLIRIENAKESGVRPAFSDVLKGFFVTKKTKRTPAVIVEAVKILPEIEEPVKIAGEIEEFIASETGADVEPEIISEETIIEEKIETKEPEKEKKPDNGKKKKAEDKE